MTVLALPAVTAASAYAQAAAMSPAAPSAGAEMNGEAIEHKELREERARLRAEHEQLEAERDKLKAECKEAVEPAAASCEEKKTDLRARLEDWHKRHQAFRQKLESEHRDYAGRTAPAPLQPFQHGASAPDNPQRTTQ